MSFANQFATYFTAEQRETELYQLWAMIGSNMEKSILEEQGKLNTEFTDINNLSEDTLRSWLAFFLMRVPYRTSATVQVSTALASSEYLETIIPQYSELSTTDGTMYTIMEKLDLVNTDPRTVTAVQGVRVVESGTYSSIIKVQATNPDLNYMTVTIGGKTIPEVSFETSYDQLLYRGTWKPQLMEGKEYGGTPYLQDAYGTKGEFYVVIAEGSAKFAETGIVQDYRVGDLLVYDGYGWQKSLANNNLTPIQFANSYAIPRNGYFAYYYDGYLYIKVFSGSEVENPEGLSYEISYIQSDGVQGEIRANTLSYVSEFEDANENAVILEVSNTASTPAINQPSRGKLGIYLKQRLYCAINVSSVPEYTMWFKAQQEVGDCLVLSDYERWVKSGRTQFTVTGIVDVYLVDPNGNNLDLNTKNMLLDRLEPYKDIAVVQISEFTEVQNFLKFEYTTSTSNESFEQFVVSMASQYYNLSYLQATNSSLFGDLDLAAVIKDIQNNSPYESTGLVVTGYHYFSFELTSPALTFGGLEGEKPGNGFYTLTAEYSEGNVVYNMNEIPSTDGNSAEIYLDDNNGNYVLVGTHVGTSITFNGLAPYLPGNGLLECYIGMENPGILTIGVENGLRKLHGVEVNRMISV